MHRLRKRLNKSIADASAVAYEVHTGFDHSLYRISPDIAPGVLPSSTGPPFGPGSTSGLRPRPDPRSARPIGRGSAEAAGRAREHESQCAGVQEEMYRPATAYTRYLPDIVLSSSSPISDLDTWNRSVHADAPSDDVLSDIVGRNGDVPHEDCSTTEGEADDGVYNGPPDGSEAHSLNEEDAPVRSRRGFRPSRRPPRKRTGRVRKRRIGAVWGNASATGMRDKWIGVRASVLQGLFRSRVLDEDQQCTVFHPGSCSGAARYR